MDYMYCLEMSLRIRERKIYESPYYECKYKDLDNCKEIPFKCSLVCWHRQGELQKLAAVLCLIVHSGQSITSKGFVSKDSIQINSWSPTKLRDSSSQQTFRVDWKFRVTNYARAQRVEICNIQSTLFC